MRYTRFRMTRRVFFGSDVLRSMTARARVNDKTAQRSHSFRMSADFIFIHMGGTCNILRLTQRIARVDDPDLQIYSCASDFLFIPMRGIIVSMTEKVLTG